MTVSHQLQFFLVKMLREGEKLLLTVFYKSPNVVIDGTLDIIQEYTRSVKSQTNCKHILYGNIKKKYD